VTVSRDHRHAAIRVGLDEHPVQKISGSAPLLKKHGESEVLRIEQGGDFHGVVSPVRRAHLQGAMMKFQSPTASWSPAACGPVAAQCRFEHST